MKQATINARRIGMVVHAYYLRDARVIRYAEALAQAGHQVTVICLQAPDEPSVENVNGVDIHRVRFERRRGGAIWYLMEYIWAFVLFALRLTRLELNQHFDLVHIHNMPDFLVFTGAIAKLRGAPIILDLHDPMPELFMSKYNMKRGLAIRLLEVQERLSCWYANHLITVDQSFKDIFVRRGISPDKISLVRNMPDDRFFVSKLENNNHEASLFTLIFAGTIAERYQIHDVIKAVKLAQPHVPTIRLQLVGKLDKEGDYTETLKALVKSLQLEDVVEIHPPVVLDMMPDLLQRAQLGLEPSRRDPYTDYVLPLKLLECIAVGIPCLVSRRPTIERYFSDQDVAYFEAGDVEGMAARIVELAGSLEKRRQLIANARHVFEHYNWPAERATYFSVLASCLERRPVMVG